MKFNLNKEPQIEETGQFKVFDRGFGSSCEFLQRFSNLINDNGQIISFITDKNIHIVTTNLLDNSVQTLKSIRLCCSIGSFTDANTLIRKLRDDLFLFIYILNIVNNRKSFVEDDLKSLDFKRINIDSFSKSFLNIRINSDLTDDEKAVEAWLNNKILELPRNIKMKLSFENYMKVLKQNEEINRIITDYNLQNYWKTLRINLNNYVHNNGSQFTAHNLIKYNNEHLEIFLQNINFRVSYTVTFFLVLIIMTQGTLISSTDIVDYLDAGIEPPEDCQYKIASFIQEYIDNKVVKLHPELKKYLGDNNAYGMRIM